MKKYQSPTSNKGTTIILDSLQDAIKLGTDKLASIITDLAGKPAKQELKVNYVQRDDLNGKKSQGKTTYGALAESYRDTQRTFNSCVEAIVKGDHDEKERISKMVEELHDLAIELAPSLKASYSGFDRSEDGVAVSTELLAAGEEQCCFKRKEGADSVKQGAGGGAYRVIINTDVSWWGQPTDNCAMVGALVVLLQQFKPIEVWVQQGWLGNQADDGVTLFKLDFAGAFDPTALVFWCGHPCKDTPFSWVINMALGRHNTSTSTYAEIEADLYLRGDWMKLQGINEDKFMKLMHTERMDLMARWVANTAMQIALENPQTLEITG